ncbi:hypothetical protein [Shewanella algicola]|uniref:hypothetical protein n=1 Tax=Shewanella algicola TaxID=640633 RepID=UPI002495A2AA|nr:hypothetical protein [Shewanella algicola]
MNHVINLIPLHTRSLDAQLRAYTGDGFGYSSFHNENDENKLEPAGVLVHKHTGQKFKVPLPTYTLAEYKKQQSIGVWTTERYDIESWEAIRHKFMGKKTMMMNEVGKTRLLIEGIHFTIR